MSLFRIARVFTYPIAALVLLAYALASYGVYAYFADTSPNGESLMVIPGSAVFALFPGAALAVFLLAYRYRLPKLERIIMICISGAGLLMLPVAFSIIEILGW